MFFLILPHQLFPMKYLNKDYTYYIWEHPKYFKKYNFNKKKLVLHRASMKKYKYLLEKNKIKVKYFEYNQTPNIKEYILFDPIDKIETLNLTGKFELIESPNFLLNKKIYQEYRKKTDKFYFNNFYMWSKEKLNIIPGIKSQDKYNRKKMPKNIEILNLPELTKSDKQYIEEAKIYVNKNFPNNYGNTDNFIYPISHFTAKKFLKDFIKNKFNLFGDYEDAIVQNESFLYHSVLSSSINIGLINPTEIIEIIRKEEKNIKLNSYEGYIRQLFWREYQRYCYIYYPFENKNYLGNKAKLNEKWYNGTLGIKPVDDCIIKGFTTGYLHHIERLMVIGNFMNLSDIHPKEGLKWFMEFSCDSYEWVMYQNVYDMVFFVSGGATMRRPYVSSSNYILNMSDYKKDKWCDIWNQMYIDFQKRKNDKLVKFRYFFKHVTKN